MILRMAWAELRNRPGRALLLLGGYALGVAVMVVLLAVGEAMLEQSRDRGLVGGGDVVVVPVGITPEMLRSGGASSLFLGIDHARFIVRQVLESPRARREFGIVAASPILSARTVEVVTGGRTFPALAAGEIPSRAAAAGAGPDLLSGAWTDGAADHAWLRPSPAALRREIDRFHLPSGPAAGDSTWAEWHYFNVTLDAERWIYVTLMVGGRIGVPGRWGGRILLTVRDSSGAHRGVTRDVPDAQVRFDTTSPVLALGADGTVTVGADGDYHVRAAAGSTRVALRVRPTPRLYFPPTELGGGALSSGYVAPALHAVAEGSVCLPRCETVRGARAYHDHNWGVWRDVSWEWGSAADSTLALLYGVVRSDSAGPGGLFAYLVDRQGVRGVFRPDSLRVTSWRNVAHAGRTVRVPAAFELDDPAGLGVAVAVSAAHVTDTGRRTRRFFVQMRGSATVRERGRAIGRLPGFFETYVD